MVLNYLISYGILLKIKRKKAVMIQHSEWLDSLDRCRNSFGLEKVIYEYWSYPSPKAEGSFWIKSNNRVLIFLSDGFLKVATESQLASMMESLNASNFQRTRKKNIKTAISMILFQLKGDSRKFRFWILSFLLYPLERFLKIAKL